MPRFSTNSIHGHGHGDDPYGSLKTPIYQTSVYEFPDPETGLPRKSDRGFDLKYSREENPTVRALEKLLARLEGGLDSLAFSSGMAAIAAVYFSSLNSGATVLLPKECYGATQALARALRRFGVSCLLERSDSPAFLERIGKEVSLVFVETVTNPLVHVADVEAIAARCSELEIPLIVDNTFATPVIYNPLMDGASLVIHSLTKYISGHNDVIGGAIVASSRERLEELWEWRRLLGSILSPFAAFLITRGAATLEPRFEKQSKTAMALAEFLRDHPKVEKVYYPGLSDSPSKSTADKLFKKRLYGGVLSFEVKGGRKAALTILRKTRIIKPSPSLGGVESLLTYPVWSAAKSMPPELRAELGITEGLLRLSIGLEDVEDLKEDLENAFKEV